MRTLKTTAFFIILVSAILTGAGIFLCHAQESYQASVEDISGDNYFPKVKDALRARDTLERLKSQKKLKRKVR